MAKNNGRYGPQVTAWRAWCPDCKLHLALVDRASLWPDEIRCPRCGHWRKVRARATRHLEGDVICPSSAGRNRVEE